MNIGNIFEEEEQKQAGSKRVNRSGGFFCVSKCEESS